MSREDLDTVLKTHRMWLEDRGGGKCADLYGADLQRVNLQEADLRWADLRWANLQGANLQGADLREADLREANLQGAGLQRVNLREADLQGADLQGADLRGADVDFSSWPLWCGTRGVRVDVRIFRQLAMHICGVVVDDDECRAAQGALMPLARKCHRAAEFLGEEQK